MSGSGPSSPYAVPLDDLVRAAHIPIDERTTEQPTGRAPAPEPEHRQLRLAGGA